MSNRRQNILIGLGVAVGILPVLFFVASFAGLAKPFRVPTGAMSPTLQPGDHVYARHYFLGKPSHGDVVVLSNQNLPISLDPNIDLRKHFFIKRLVGLPGDHVQLKNKTLFVNSDPFPTPKGIEYVALGPFDIATGITVPEENYFVLGDNSPNSSDSRVWGFLPKENLFRKATLIYWPPSRAGAVH